MGSPEQLERRKKKQTERRFEGSQVSVWDGVIRAAGRTGESIRNFKLQQEEKRNVMLNHTSVLV